MMLVNLSVLTNGVISRSDVTSYDKLLNYGGIIKAHAPKMHIQNFWVVCKI